jgi:hypothetical protein
LVENLKNEEDAMRIKHLRFVAGHTFSRKNKYIEMENDFFLKNRYSGREF